MQKLIILIIFLFVDYNFGMFIPENLLTNAIMEDSPKIVSALIADGININFENDCKTTPLHLAAILNNFKIAALLIKAGAKVDAQDILGASPLHYTQNTDIILLLIKHDANYNIKDNDKLTPLDWSIRFDDEAKTQLLSEIGAHFTKKLH